MMAERPDAAGLRLELEDGQAVVLWLESPDEQLAGVLGLTTTETPWPPAETVRRLELKDEPASEEKKLDWMAFHITVTDKQVVAAWGSGDTGDSWEEQEVTISSSAKRLVLFVRSGHARFHDFRSRSLQ